MNLKTLKEWEDWKVVGIEPTNVQGKVTDWGIQFLNPPYKNTVVAIGEISISDIDSDQDGAHEGMLSFNYELYNNPNDITPETHPEFENYVGDVIVATFSQALEEGNAVINEREPEQNHPTITLDE
tara:strand:- start:1803 stop:2180 length:378 start_codon:yes stop_codon:yes gene_type:complete